MELAALQVKTSDELQNFTQFIKFCEDVRLNPFKC